MPCEVRKPSSPCRTPLLCTTILHCNPFALLPFHPIQRLFFQSLAHSSQKHRGYTPLSNRGPEMTHSLALTKDRSRCSYRTPAGRRCRQSAQNATLSTCRKHADPHFRARVVTNFHSTLTRDSEEFTTARGIHSSLSELYRLLAEDRISTRRASVLAYITQLLLRTLPLAIAEANLTTDKTPPIVDFGDLPRPDRSGVPQPPSDSPNPQ
jgi:hypothetical protein